MLRPEYLTFSGVLNKRLFEIPNYQRTYSWHTKQRQELFSDIKKLRGTYDEHRHHFMATIVCLNKDMPEEIGSDELQRLDVVDGQQRLTTLIILMKSVSKALLQGDKGEQNEAVELDKLLVKGDKRLILLQTNHDEANIFSDYLRKGAIPENISISMSSEKNLQEAFLECEEFVSDWKNEYSLLDLLKILKNRLDFIFYVLDNEGAVYTVFEVLNSRGLEVDWLDKCKSMLMGIAFEKFNSAASKEHIKELHQKWSKIYNNIGLRPLLGREILSFAATLLHGVSQSKPLSTEKSVEYFRSECTNEVSKIIEITDWISNVTIKLKDLYNNPRLNAVTDISHARLLAVSIMSRDDFSIDDKAEVLSEWEKITFRIFGLCRRDSRYKVGDYTNLAHKITFIKPTKDEIIAELKKIGIKYPIEDAMKELKGADCYNGWESDLRYFLYRYEEFLAKQAGEEIGSDVWEKIWSNTPSTTIEHIHPQKLNEIWKNKISNRQDHVDLHVNRIGNLLLLPPRLNSKCGQKAFDLKKDIYRTTGLRMINEIMQLSDWDKKAIDERELKLIEFAKITWGD